MIRSLLRPLTSALTSALAAVLLVACSEDKTGTEQTAASNVPEIYRPTLSFYHIPNCFLCQELSTTLTELEKKHGRFMNFRTVDYHLPASQERIFKAQLGSHGIIVSDPEGAELWKMKAHEESKEDLTAAVKRLTSR